MNNGKETILVADAVKGKRKPLCKRLQSEGYICIEAGNADQTLERIEAKSADLVLLDIQLTGKSKKGLLPEIKGRYQDVLVVTTADADDIGAAVESLKQGAYDYVTKPFNLDDVVHSVNRATEKRRLELKLRDLPEYVDRRIAEHAKETHQTFMEAMAALAFALEARDSYTTGHSQRVADITTAIGAKLGLGQDELDDLRWGSRIHDIGKIAVDRSITNKADKLTAKEYDHVMAHTTIGANIVESVAKNTRITEVVRYHHAHYDGNGLNQKYMGKDIPLLARIVAVADAYDAMTSARPYRSAWSKEASLSEIKWETGKQFDPSIVNAFLETLEVDTIPEKRKILIADDEEGVKQLVRSVLSNDYTVIEATNGQEAIEASRNQNPSLILLDTLMPGKDGLRTLYEIKTTLTTSTIPVVMLTEESQEQNRRYSAELGADQCITKPFTPKDLLDTVDQFLKNLE